MRSVTKPAQRGECECLVAVALVNAEETDRRGRKQLVNGRLNFRAHMSGKLSRCRNQLVPRNTGEVPLNGGTGKVELSCSREIAQIARNLQCAVGANQCRLACQAELVARKIAAQFTALILQVVTGLGRHHQWISRCLDPLLGNSKE